MGTPARRDSLVATGLHRSTSLTARQAHHFSTSLGVLPDCRRWGGIFGIVRERLCPESLSMTLTIRRCSGSLTGVEGSLPKGQVKMRRIEARISDLKLG